MLTANELLNLPPEQQRQRRRGWNRENLRDLFPRVPDATLERLLDVVIDKNFVYNFSQSRIWNARRYTSIVVAHVRHNFSDYDKLLRESGTERFAARQETATQVWKVLRDWCPWDTSNEVLEKCFKATLVPPDQRGPDWDPMDIDEDSDYEEFDPMEIDG